MKAKIEIVVNNRNDRTDLILRVEEDVRKRWDSRAKAQGYKKGTKTYNNLRTEFMLGMVAAMDCFLNADETGESSITPKLFFELIRGE